MPRSPPRRSDSFTHVFIMGISAPVRDRASAPALTIDDEVRRAQRGDLGAFEAIYRSHAASVHTLVRRMVADEREARELTQDAFFRAWERLTSFKGQSSLRTWLHRVAVNVVLEHLRGAKRDALRMIDVDDVSLTSRSDAGNLDARMDINMALARLPAGSRTVFVLHDVEGYSHEEIADMTGLAQGTTRAQLFRARQRLMTLLDL
jgi:RNA polymerase sigma-70 factor (ECF subfamily)